MDSLKDPSTRRGASLATASPGAWVCVSVVGDMESQTRLKQMGICEGRRLTVLQSGDPMIVYVVGAQIALSRMLAGFVEVSALELETNR